MSKLQESGSATQTERRRSTRYPFGAVLEMEWGSAVIRGSVIDITAEAMRIEIADPLRGGARAAAEVLLRRRLMLRTAWFLVGAVLFLPASQLFPPLELDAILIFIGVMFFLVLGLGVWVERRARHHLEVEALKRVYFGFVPVPW